MNNNSIEEIKNMIEIKQKELNKLLGEDKVNKEQALSISIELDKLIYKYYSFIK